MLRQNGTPTNINMDKITLLNTGTFTGLELCILQNFTKKYVLNTFGK